MVIAIVAVDDNLGISRKGAMPWSIPSDLWFFKAETMGNMVVMGRITYDVVGKPLVGRDNLVLSRRSKHITGAKVFSSREAVLGIEREKNLFIAGGSDIYNLFANDIDVIYITRVVGDFGCDRYFPDLFNDFSNLYRSDHFTENGCTYYHEYWVRNQLLADSSTS